MNEDNAAETWPVYYVIIPNLFIGILLCIAFHFIRKKGAEHLRMERYRMEVDRRMREEYRLNHEQN